MSQAELFSESEMSAPCSPGVCIADTPAVAAVRAESTSEGAFRRRCDEAAKSAAERFRERHAEFRKNIKAYADADRKWLEAMMRPGHSSGFDWLRRARAHRQTAADALDAMRAAKNECRDFMEASPVRDHALFTFVESARGACAVATEEFEKIRF